MKTQLCITLWTTTLVLATPAGRGRAEAARTSAPPAPPSHAVIRIDIGEAASVGVDQPAESPGVDPTAHWVDIKDCDSGMRPRFFAGLRRLQSRTDTQYSELTARRARMTTPEDIRRLEQALQEFRTAQFFLMQTGQALTWSAPATWDEQKALVGLAWRQAQEAYTTGMSGRSI